MLAIPAETPVTIPEETPAVAIPGFEEVQVPPAVALLSVVEWPSHIEVTPVIGGSAAKERKVQNSNAVSSVRFFISISLVSSYLYGKEFSLPQ